MGKIIRHLEYYGYADQNIYLGLPNCDLSDIHETNREQDKEIDAISGATKDKVDITVFNELSGKVDTFIDTESTINEGLAKAISANTMRIESLEQRDVEITDKINEIVDKFDPLYDDVEALSALTIDMNDRLNEHLSATSEFEDSITEQISGITEELDKKLDASTADEIYAKKEDVYTKSEIDDLIIDGVSGFATQQWVLDRHYISEDDADTKYASKSRLTALEDRVTDVQTTLYDQYNTLNSDFIQYKTVTDGRLTSLTDRVGTLESKHDREIANLQNTDANLQQQINASNEAIKLINEVSLPNKVDKSEFNDLKAQVSTFDERINNKLDKSTYESDKEKLALTLDKLDDKKADKATVEAISGAVDTVKADIQAETTARMEADDALGKRIDETNNAIDDIKEFNVDIQSGLSALNTALQQEIQDRKDGDSKLLGTSADTDSAITIYGTRAYADKVSAQALASAKLYADTKESDIHTYINNEVIAPLQQEITAKADKTYVDAVKSEVLTEVDGKIEAEAQRAMAKEDEISRNLRQETNRAIDEEKRLSSGLTETSNIVAAITDWRGANGEEYTDEGNGILDVLHRQFHDLKESLGNLGEGVITSNDHEVAFGTYNQTHTGENNSEKTIFSVGVGTSDDDRQNAIELRKNGDLYLWIEGQFICINNLIAMLANETY